MIFVKNLESISDQEWSTTEKYPGVRWKFLIDADFTKSSSLSLGFAEIAPGGNLILHYHSPAEIYVITEGKGMLNKSGEIEEIKKGDVVATLKIIIPKSEIQSIDLIAAKDIAEAGYISSFFSYLYNVFVGLFD